MLLIIEIIENLFQFVSKIFINFTHFPPGDVPTSPKIKFKKFNGINFKTLNTDNYRIKFFKYSLLTESGFVENY